MPGLIKGLQPYSPHWKNHGTGGGTSFTLDVSSTTNATILIVGGVIQLAGTDYTVSGTTVTTTTSVTSGVEVISAVLYNLGSVTTPAAGSVDFASLGFTSQAQGDILYRDSSTWARLPAGTSGQFLKTQGTGANPTWASAGGGWEFVSSQTASGASIAFEGLAAGYDYQVSANQYDTSADHLLYITLGTGSTTYASSGYDSQTVRAYDTTVNTSEHKGAAQIRCNSDDFGGAGGDEPVSAIVTMYDPGDSSCYTWLEFKLIGDDINSEPSMQTGVGQYSVDAAVTAIKFAPSAGTFSSGKFTLFKRANA